MEKQVLTNHMDSGKQKKYGAAAAGTLQIGSFLKTSS